MGDFKPDDMVKIPTLCFLIQNYIADEIIDLYDHSGGLSFSEVYRILFSDFARNRIR